MARVDRQTASFGIGNRRAEPVIWRVTRLDACDDAQDRSEPSQSLAGPHSRAYPARETRSSPYRIRRISR